MEFTLKELVFYGALGSFIIGSLLGLIPLFFGIKKNKRKLGIYGLVTSAIGGSILSAIFSIIVVVVFTWQILKKPSADTSENVSSDSNETSQTENSSESEISSEPTENSESDIS